MESTVDTDYNALVLEARKRFSARPAVQRQLHAREVGGQRPDLDDLLQQQPGVRLPDGEGERRGQRDDAVEQRPASPLRRQLPLPARLHVGHRRRRHPDARIRAAAYAAHQRRRCPPASAPPSRARPTARAARPSSPWLGSTAIARRAARPSTSARRRSSASAARPERRFCGRCSTSSTPRTTRTFGDTAFDVVTAPPPTMRLPTWHRHCPRRIPGSWCRRTASSNFWGMRDMQLGLRLTF